MESLNDLFGNYHLAIPIGRTSERAELLKYFLGKLNKGNDKMVSPSYLGFRLSHLALKDLYYMKSVGEDCERRGYPFSKYFWGSLKVKNT